MTIRANDDSAPAFAGNDLPLAVIERIADRFKLLGDPTRLRLVNALYLEGELAVGELVDRLGSVSYGAVSKQLSLLRSQGVIARRRDGQRILYSICDPSVSDLCDAACRGVHDNWKRAADVFEQPAS